MAHPKTNVFICNYFVIGLFLRNLMGFGEKLTDINEVVNTGCIQYLRCLTTK